MFKSLLLSEVIQYLQDINDNMVTHIRQTLVVYGVCPHSAWLSAADSL